MTARLGKCSRRTACDAPMRHALRMGLSAVLVLLPLHAAAHRVWLLPSATVVGGPEAVITVDAAVSENLFDFDANALKLDALTVTGPDGQRLTVDAPTQGRRRSTFDVALRTPGSHRITQTSDTTFATYTLDGETKRWRGAPAAMASEVPATAQALQVTRVHQRVETFVALERAGGNPFVPSAQGLELQTPTPATDLIAGDTSLWRLLLDGQPAANVQVTVVRGGNRYRYKLDEITLRTDADGRFTLRWPQPGMYWLHATVNTPAVLPAGERPQRRATYSATVEVLLP